MTYERAHYNIRNFISLESLFWVLGVSCLTFYFLLLTISDSLLLLHLAVTKNIVSISCVLMFPIIVLLWRNKTSNDHVLPVVFLVILFLTILFISFTFGKNTIDLSIDGQFYHQTAVYQLFKGWNPYFENASLYSDSITEPILNQYAKGVWIVLATISKFLNSIEASKGLNFFVLLTCFLIAYPTIKAFFPGMSLLVTIFLSVLVAANPISIVQLMTFYIDGQLASFITILICSLLLFLIKLEKIYLLPIFFATIILINIKISAVVFSIILLIICLIYVCFFHKTEFRKFLFITTFSLFFGVVVFGYNPYITNILFHEDWYSTTAIIPNTPFALRGKGFLEKFYLSISSSSASPFDGNLIAKLPFTTSVNEILRFQDPDVRINGFGPFYSGAFLVGAIITCYHLLNKKSFVDTTKRLILFGILIVICSSGVNPEFWWARYVPQLWLFPIFSYTLLQSTSEKYIKLLKPIIIVILTINIFLISVVNFSMNIAKQNIYREQLLELSKLDVPVKVVFTPFIANQLRFDQMGIAYETVQGVNCSNPIFLVGSNNKICVK